VVEDVLPAFSSFLSHGVPPFLFPWSLQPVKYSKLCASLRAIPGILLQKLYEFSQLRQFSVGRVPFPLSGKQCRVTKNGFRSTAGQGLSSAPDFGIIRDLNRQKSPVSFKTTKKSIFILFIFPAISATKNRHLVPRFGIGMLPDSPLQGPLLFREHIDDAHPKDFGFLS
jgi:hypothetical protein